MTEDKQKQLEEKYPDIIKTSCDVDDGWYVIIDSLCECLQCINNQLGITVQTLQVKEKFGSLRFYTFTELGDVNPIWRTIINKLISNTEYKSAEICEKCGGYGKLRNSKHWKKTLCDLHAKEEGYTD